MLHFTLGFASKLLADVLRFVFTKSRLRTRYKSLFLVFSGRLHDAIMSGMTVENVFMGKNILRTCLWTLTVRMMFLEIVEFALPRMMYLLDNNNFQTALYFNWFCMSTFLNMVEMIFVENVCFSGLAFLQRDWKKHLLHVHVQMHEFGMFVLQLEFGM